MGKDDNRGTVWIVNGLRCETRHESIRLRKSSGPCEVCTWPDDGLPRRLVDTLRARHGHGGLNVCDECVARAHRLAAQNTAIINGQPSVTIDIDDANAKRLLNWLDGKSNDRTIDVLIDGVPRVLRVRTRGVAT